LRRVNCQLSGNQLEIVRSDDSGLALFISSSEAATC
jgi:hypothetical protein